MFAITSGFGSLAHDIYLDMAASVTPISLDRSFCLIPLFLEYLIFVLLFLSPCIRSSPNCRYIALIGLIICQEVLPNIIYSSFELKGF